VPILRVRPSAVSLYFIATVCMLLFTTSTMSACNQSQRQDTLHASVLAVQAAEKGFLPWDKQHQQAILDAAPTREEYDKAIAAYRARQAEIATGITLAYKTLAIAATQTDDPSLTAAIAASQDLIATIKQMIGSK